MLVLEGEVLHNLQEQGLRLLDVLGGWDLRQPRCCQAALGRYVEDSRRLVVPWRVKDRPVWAQNGDLAEPRQPGYVGPGPVGQQRGNHVPWRTSRITFVVKPGRNRRQPRAQRRQVPRAHL